VQGVRCGVDAALIACDFFAWTRPDNACSLRTQFIASIAAFIAMFRIALQVDALIVAARESVAAGTSTGDAYLGGLVALTVAIGSAARLVAPLVGCTCLVTSTAVLWIFVGVHALTGTINFGASTVFAVV
jgi:hypothetical protein